jgi:L-2-hydroxyglutarate oxidase LhgO
VDTLDYDVDPSHAHVFLQSARILLPFLEPDDLSPDMAGIRPKIQKPGDPVRDFVIAHEAARGLPGMITLAGMESPGLTSCLAIGEYVAGLLKEAGLTG